MGKCIIGIILLIFIAAFFVLSVYFCEKYTKFYKEKELVKSKLASQMAFTSGSLAVILLIVYYIIGA